MIVRGATSWLLAWSLVLCIGARATAIEVEDILRSPGAYVHERVELEGSIDRLLKEGSATTDFYVLEDDFGNSLRVRSAEGYPKVGKRYRVTGVISIHSNSKNPYLSELKRVALDEAPAPATEPEPAPQAAASPQPVPQPIPVAEPETKTGHIIGIVMLVLAVMLLGAFLVYKKRESEMDGIPLGAEDDEVRGPSVGDGGFAAPQVFETSTMKIEISPATMKFMPGGFEILAGEEKGRTLRIQGYPTPEGAETTIGREEVAGDRRFAHVQLKEPTVSRKQAKLLTQNGQYFLMNLGSTNPTQVNGRNLGVNETVELEPDDTIRLGEVELRFTL